MAVCDVHYQRRTFAERMIPAFTVGALLFIAALATALRFHGLGLRTFQGDETVSSLLANQLARGNGYEHLPVLHGPAQYFASAATLKLVGASDLTARAAPALCGVMLALLPFLFVRHIGRVGAIAAALLLAVSPSLLYFSRFAGPDIYLAFFSLATAMLLWRYLVAPERAYLYLIAATLAGMVVSSEMALVVAAIFAAYLHYRTGIELMAQSNEPRASEQPPTHYDLLGVSPDADVRKIRLAYRKAIDVASTKPERVALAEAYSVLTFAGRRAAYDRKLARVQVAIVAQVDGTERSMTQRGLLMVLAAPIALLWLFAGSMRRRLNLTRLPVAASPLILLTMLMLPFYGPLVEKLPFVGDRGFAGQTQVYVLGAASNPAPGGELPVMLATLGVLFAVAAIIGIAWRWHVWLICWAMFYGIALTMFTGFFTNKGGVWTGLWGTLDYWWRPEARTPNGTPFYYAMVLPVYEIVPLAIAAAAFCTLFVRGDWRNRAVVGAATMLIGATLVAPEWLAPVAANRTLALLLISCGAVLALRVPPLTKFLAFWTVAAFLAFTMIGRKEPQLAMHIAVPLALLAAKLIADALAALEMPQLAAPTLGFDAPRRLAQGFALAGVGAGMLFAAHTAIDASWGHGSLANGSGALATRDHGDVATELLSADTTSPDVREVRAAIARAAAASPNGANISIAVDTSYSFAAGWLWYLRDYPNLQIEDMRKDFHAPAGSIVLFDARNRDKIHIDGTATALAFTERWSFPADFQRADGAEARSAITSGSWWSRWSHYIIDRDRAGQPDVIGGMAYFPQQLNVSLPPNAKTSEVLASSVAPAAP